MKKGEKPPRKQTNTLMTINKIVYRIRALKSRADLLRPLFEDEKAEYNTLIWVLKMLKFKDGDVIPDFPEGNKE